MAFPPVQLPARLSAMLGKGETSPCLWAWICSSSFLNPCFLALIPVASPSLVFELPVPDSLLDMVIPIPIWFRGDRCNFVPWSPIQGNQGPRRKTNEEMKGRTRENKS